MTLEEKISKDYVQAMKDKDAVKSSTLSFLRAQLKNVLIDKRIDKLDDGDVISIIKKQVKQRQDSIGQFQQGGRQDLVAKETQELDILKSYLPAEMSESDLKVLVEESIKEANALSAKDMGKVMKILLLKVAGRADSKMVSDLVKQKLS